MLRTAVVCDSASDLTRALAKKYEIYMVETPIIIDGTSFLLGDYTMEEFYKMVDNAQTFPTTSQPSVQQFVDAYNQAAADGYDQVLSIHISSKLSGTINSARLATESVDIPVAIADTMVVASPQFACILYARQLAATDLPIATMAKLVEECGASLRGYISLSTLDNLVRSGRITRPRYLLGKLLKFNALITIGDGILKPFGKTRNLSKARDIVYSYATQDFDAADEVNYVISHSVIPEVAKAYEQRLLQEFPRAKGLILDLGSISIHAGKGCLLIFMYKLPNKL